MSEEVIYTSDGADWDEAKDSLEWERSIELKISTQGKILVGLAAGVGVSLLLTGLQGKVVIDVIKVQKALADTVNAITTILNPSTGSTGRSAVSYGEPEKTVEQPPVDNDELKDIVAKIQVTQSEAPQDPFS